MSHSVQSGAISAIMNQGIRANRGGRGETQAADVRLTSSELIRISHFAVPEPLAPFVTTLYHFTCDEARLSDVIPAGIGYVMVLLKGTPSVTFGDKVAVLGLPLSLLTPTSAAAQVQADGALHLVGAALSPLGWGSLTALPAFDYRDRVLPADDFLGEDAPRLLARWQDGYASGLQGGEAISLELAAALASRMTLPPPRHIALIRDTGAWLSSSLAPAIGDLGTGSGYSSRQIERLVKRYFGATPGELVRKYRALRVAALLQSPDCTDEQAAQLIDLFYDQSHLIREMRHYLGRTPSRLAGEESALTRAVNGIDNYREREPSFARIPEG